MSVEPGAVLVHLRIAGMLLAGVVVLHAFVPARLRWRDDLAQLSLVNRQIFEVHAIFIVLTVALCAALLLTRGEALLAPTPLSRAVLAGLIVFWGLRMLMQWLYYSPAIWRGNRFNTAAHYACSALWVYVTGTFVAALWSNLAQGSSIAP